MKILIQECHLDQSFNQSKTQKPNKISRDDFYEVLWPRIHSTSVDCQFKRGRETYIEIYCHIQTKDVNTGFLGKPFTGCWKPVLNLLPVYRPPMQYYSSVLLKVCALLKPGRSSITSLDRPTTHAVLVKRWEGFCLWWDQAALLLPHCTNNYYPKPELNRVSNDYK